MTTGDEVTGGTTTLTAEEHRDLARTIALVLEVGILERTSGAGSDAAAERVASLVGESQELAPRLEKIFTSHAGTLRSAYEAAGGGTDAAQAAGPALSPEARERLVQLVQAEGSGDVVAAAVGMARQAAAMPAPDAALRDDVGVPSVVHHVLQGLALASSLTLGPEVGAVFEVIDIIFHLFG